VVVAIVVIVAVVATVVVIAVIVMMIVNDELFIGQSHTAYHFLVTSLYKRLERQR